MDKSREENTEIGIFTVENAEQEETKSKKTLSPKKIKFLIAVVLGNLFLGSCYAIMAPIFPPKAEEKNASPLAYGFVFGIYYFTLLISSPVYGKLTPILKPRFMMKAGMMMSGVCNILFGLLDYAPAGPVFIGLALTVRFLDALGASAYFIASYATVGCEFSDIMGRAMSLMETAVALGLTGGPVFAGFFFQLGGFKLPFIVIGLILIAGAIINIFLFSGEDSDIPGQSISALKLLKDVDFMIDIIANSSAFALLAFNDASLEPHIRQFNPSAVTTGLVFLAAGLSDAVFAPVWGYLSEKVPNAQCLTFLGSLVCVIYFLFLGPASFLNFETSLWVVTGLQVLLGLAYASLIVCSTTHAMKHTVSGKTILLENLVKPGNFVFPDLKKLTSTFIPSSSSTWILKIRRETGFPDDVGTYSVVSGVMLSASCVGGFIGPSLGGVLIDKIGYIHTTMVAAGLGTMVAVIFAGRLAHLFFKKRKEYN